MLYEVSWQLGSYQKGCTQVCVSCWQSNATTIMCGMMIWDGKLSNYIFRLLFKHGVSACLEFQTNQMPSSFPLGELEETTGTGRPPYHVDEPLPEKRNNWRNSESSTLEIDVYVWRYALIVVLARNEWMNEWMKRPAWTICCRTNPTRQWQTVCAMPRDLNCC